MEPFKVKGITSWLDSHGPHQECINEQGESILRPRTINVSDVEAAVGWQVQVASVGPLPDNMDSLLAKLDPVCSASLVEPGSPEHNSSKWVVESNPNHASTFTSLSKSATCRSIHRRLVLRGGPNRRATARS